MGRRKKIRIKRKIKRRLKLILGMVLIPALFAAVLFSITDKKAGSKGSGSEGAKSGRETLVTQESEENDVGRDTVGNDSDLEEADSENDGEAEMAADQTYAEWKLINQREFLEYRHTDLYFAE